MRWHTTNYLNQEHGSERRQPLVDVGFWLSDLPRLTWRCWVWGHKAVVDGTNLGRRHTRWVACDRCGLRPDPQGNLNSALDIGQPYTDYQSAIKVALGVGLHPPGPWPRGKGEVGGQIILGDPSATDIGFGFTVGCAGSDSDLAGHISLGWLGALHWHTEGFGRWLQRRLVSAGYENRVTGLHISEGHLRWEIWARDNSGNRASDPWWRRGYKSIDPRTWIWGQSRYWSYSLMKPVASVLSLPEEDYAVNLQLKRYAHGRPRSTTRAYHYTVEVKVVGEGIPTERGDHGRTTAFNVRVPDASDTWEESALRAALARIASERADNNYFPTVEIEVDDGCPDATTW